MSYQKEHLLFKFKFYNSAFIGLIFLICLFNIGIQQQEESREITIRGSVVNEEGYPVGNIPVILIMQRRGYDKNDSAIEILEENSISTRSDSKGLYEIIWLEDSTFNNFYLRSYREGDFDEVLYQQPQDVDITRQIKLSSTIKVDHILKFNSEWEKIKAEVERLGLDSDKGRILRQRGLPDKKEKFKGKKFKNMEIWWYYSKGICYRFKGTMLDKIFRFNSSAVEDQLKEKRSK